MGLLRRKRDKGLVDLGDGNVAISPERADEMTDQTVERVMELYDEEIPAGSVRAIQLAVARRHGSDPGDLLGSLLVSHTCMGYCSRQFEDQMETTEAVVPWLTREIERRFVAGDDQTRDLAATIAEIAVDLCDYKQDDPNAPRSIDAIDSPLAPLRSEVCKKLSVAAANLAASQGLSEPGEFPESVDAEEMLAIWRIGFLVRACEVSLPPSWVDPSVTLIVVDSEAAREAAYRWADEHPEASQQETDEATKRIMLDPRFRIDVDDERVGVDPRFIMFELDANGEITPQPENDEPEADRLSF
jgi:propanediol dehydratase small subunit